MNEQNNSFYRQDLETFLDKSSDGLSIKLWFEEHKSLTDDLITDLVRLIIEREIWIIFKQNNVSLANPLPKLK